MRVFVHLAVWAAVAVLAVCTWFWPNGMGLALVALPFILAVVIAISALADWIYGQIMEWKGEDPWKRKVTGAR